MSRLHPFARLLIAALGLLAVQAVLGSLVSALYIAWAYPAPAGESAAARAARIADAVGSNTLALTLFVYPASILWLGFCRARLDKRSFVSLGLRRPRLAPNLARGALAGLLSIALLCSILWLSGALAVNGFSPEAREAGARVIFPLLGWAIAFAAVGFFEELTFRGYALHNLTNWLGWRGAVAVQAAIFAVVHLGNVALVPKSQQAAALLAALGALPSLFLVAVFFALAYRKTGSLWFPIGFHAAWNFSLGCLFSLAVSGLNTFKLLDVAARGQSWFSGGSFGAEGSFILVPILLVALWLLSQAPDHPQALLDLNLIERPAPQPQQASQTPQLVAPPTPEIEVAEEIEDADRENRFRTKFGTREGFDEGMLRELRALQQQREAAEAQARREHETETQAVAIAIEPMQPAVAETADQAETVQPVEVETAAATETAPELTPVVAPPTPQQVEEPAQPVTTPPAKPRRSVVFAPRADAPEPAPQVAAPETVKTDDAPAKVETPAPVAPPKKAAPRW